ncbi:hypothetical protein [Streptomyces sp. NBC_00996]|uniref:hypothetical protein n=1 Tax=Streptomyces sp. NBC_00996 TaxID=2903710 RepID=UPI00386321DD|nr:hypothetical protein OG390_15275 [Streptomyces sp. NBC_00996]
MPMQPKGSGEIPAETVRVARAAFPKGSLAIRVRDELGSLFSDEEFADLFFRHYLPQLTHPPLSTDGRLLSPEEREPTPETNSRRPKDR